MTDRHEIRATDIAEAATTDFRAIRQLVPAIVAALHAVESENAERMDRLTEALHRIEVWSRAYPVSTFREPDMAKAAELLKDGGITLDAVSAAAMRHVVEGVGKLAREALATMEQGKQE